MATFRQRKGRWQAIIRRSDLKASKTFDRLVDARSWATAMERDADVAGHMPGKVAGTLKPLIERYERELWPQKRWGANKAYELGALQRDFGPRLLTGLTQAELLAYVRRLGVGPSTAANRLSYLREVLKAARDLWGLGVPLDQVDGAIAAGRRHGVLGKSNSRDRRPTPDEIERIVGWGQERPGARIDLHVVVRVLSVMPLRLGELLGIQWDDAVEDRRAVILRGRKHPDIREKEKPQEVPLIAFGGVDTYDLVFGRPRYMASPFPYKGSSVSTAFTQAARILGIKDLHLHDLRAYAISRLLEGGLAIPLVATLSGHRNWKVLQRNYARIESGAVHEAIKRLT
jgi:integrase